MVSIQRINNYNNVFSTTAQKVEKNSIQSQTQSISVPQDFKQVSSANLMAYHPSFTSITKNNQIPSKDKQIRTIKTQLDRETQVALNRLEQKGILDNKNSNDGSTVLNNLYKIATEPRMRGLSHQQILTEVITALDNPYTITQKFGDIPQEVANEIAQETGKEFPKNALNVTSSSCVAASIEFNLASQAPAEFARFANGLSSPNYSVDRKVKMTTFSNGVADGLWKLREFNTDNKIDSNWDDVTIKISPDRNAIVRARVQSTYRDQNERSSIDVLMQSAILNLCSQNTYDSITDERTGKFNADKTGLTDFEKNFGEQVIFGTPKVSVVYQNLDENGYLVGYNCEHNETKQHIINSLKAGQNVIIGYTHMDENKQVNGGHEITIVGYEQDKNGNGYFVCNDTDDNIDEAIKYKEEELLPLIHHAGISKEALNEDDTIAEPWREYLDMFKSSLNEVA